jgi:predicted transglutaminase-like cysteine proteinase
VLPIALCFAAGTVHSSEPAKGTGWDDAVFDAIAKDHGERAAKRLRDVQDLIRENREKTTDEKLEVVNKYMNKLKWIADPDLWKRPDYWATPFETIATFGGDCEDIAIAKYLTLRLMGVPDAELGFGLVENRKGTEGHMVLLYQKAPGDEVLVLDNNTKRIKPAKDRRDLVASYAFKNDGKLYMYSDDGKERKVKAKYDNRRMEKWMSVKERTVQNLKKYEQYNAGRPLLNLGSEPEAGK